MMDVRLMAFFALFLLVNCIGDDLLDNEVPANLRIISSVDSIAVGDQFQMDAMFTNNVGQETDATIEWESTVADVLTVSENGLLDAVAPGDAMIIVTVSDNNEIYRDSILTSVGDVTVVTNPIRSGSLKTTSSYALAGDFTLEKSGTDLILSLDETYIASENLPGLFVYLTKNPSTINGALEIGAVQVFNGAHEYVIPGDLTLEEYSHVLYFCKPFTVKVGDGAFDN